MTEENQNEKDVEEGHHYLKDLEERVITMLHDVPESVHDVFQRHRRTTFERHPFLFSTLGLFGLVATWQGFDDLIGQVDLFNQHPSLLLLIGLLMLLLTGRLYRQLDR